MNTDTSTHRPLRLWPGLAAAALLLLIRYVIPVVMPGTFGLGIIGGFIGTLVILVWWLFFSRAAWAERLGAIVLMIVAVAATWLTVHESIRGGFMGNMVPLYAVPILSLALVFSAWASRGLAAWPRRAMMVVAFALVSGAFMLLRTDGIMGDDGSQLAWRWTPTPEQRLLAHSRNEPVAPGNPAAVPATAPAPPPAAPVVKSAGESGAAGASTASEPRTAREPGPATSERAVVRVEWPGFRGPARDGVIPRVRIETDWSVSPPVQLWRQPIGPGWSSFAVSGDLIYTQEQRGENEVVSCYRLATGEAVWRHSDAVRFYESNGGAGPRGTPAVQGDRVYSLGATGIMNALDAVSGALVWSRNAASDTGKEIPGWGLTSSPLVVGDVVIVAVAGQLIAYDAATGAERWIGEAGGGGYSSPHLATIGGVPQVLLVRGARTISVAPADGTLLWEHSWEPAVSILQPAVTPDGSVLIAAGDMMGGMGMRRIAVAPTLPGWTVEERWTSRGLKPYFNDFVVHEGHAFGFDGSILAAIDLADGARKWKGGRYGHGQILLLPEQDLLLVLSEEGELALVSATPDTFMEVARFKAIDGKTWNHPVLIGDVLLVRNGEEMAAFRLSPARR